MKYIKPIMGYYDLLYHLNQEENIRESLQKKNYLRHRIIPSVDLITLFLFLKKIEFCIVFLLRNRLLMHIKPLHSITAKIMWGNNFFESIENPQFKFLKSK